MAPVKSPDNPGVCLLDPLEQLETSFSLEYENLTISRACQQELVIFGEFHLHHCEVLEP